MTHTRTRDPDLAWLLDVLWGPDLETEPSPGATAVRVVPNERRPRAVVPDDRVAAARGLRAGGGTRSRAAQRARWMVAAAVRAGAFASKVWIAADDPLRAAIHDRLGGGEVLLACAVRRPGPFRKPVVQVARPGGEVIAYAKVAWNDVTAANVRAEHAALTAIAANDDDRIAAPRPIGLAEHRGFPLLLTQPMPVRLRRSDPTGPPPDPDLSLAVARVLEGSAGPDPVGSQLRRRLVATHAPDLAGVHAATAHALELLGERTTALPPGAWHGDWSPWNLGWVDGLLWAWDWEYCRNDVPVGLDVPHFLFQRAFIAERSPLPRSFALADTGSADALAALGYMRAERAAVHAVHVIEIALRFLEAATLGVAANPRFVDGAAEALDQAVDALD